MIPETKQCTYCLRQLPNTSEYFHSNGKTRTPPLRSGCKECRRRSEVHRYSKFKKSIFLKYSKTGKPFCICCYEQNYNFLTLDHINGEGNIHRRFVGSGTAMFRWLKRNNYPPGYQILCANCNLSKGKGTKCIGHNKELV